MPSSEFRHQIIEQIKTHLDVMFPRESDRPAWRQQCYLRFFFNIFAQAYAGTCPEDRIHGQIILDTLRETWLKGRSAEEEREVPEMFHVWDMWMFAWDNYPQPE